MNRLDIYIKMEKRQKVSGPRLLNNFFLNSIEKAATVQSLMMKRSHPSPFPLLLLYSPVLVYPARVFIKCHLSQLSVLHML